jgi:hypothetical protein
VQKKALKWAEKGKAVFERSNGEPAGRRQSESVPDVRACFFGCPARGQDVLDPRKIICMATLSLDNEIITSDWAGIRSM